MYAVPHTLEHAENLCGLDCCVVSSRGGDHGVAVPQPAEVAIVCRLRSA